MKTSAGATGRLTLICSALVFVFHGGPRLKAASWATNSPMTLERAFHTATLLPNGKLLVAGGSGILGEGPSLSSSELYDPVSGKWTLTSAMHDARRLHTATLLANGKVLVVGGIDDGFPGYFVTSAELYDPDDGTWTLTGANREGRIRHTATLMANGKVLVAGGGGPSTPLSSAELYDSATGFWTSTDAMNTGHCGHTATFLPSGKVLIVGGYRSGDGAELYDPDSGKWTWTGSMGAGRVYHSATLLADGRLMVVGGYSDDALATAELYDSATGTWMPTGSMAWARHFHTASLLPKGQVLVVGGYAFGNGYHTTMALYDPTTGIWAESPALTVVRAFQTATVLGNGSLLVVGGDTVIANYYVPISLTERYDPAEGAWTPTGDLGNARAGHRATLLPNGKILVVGGIGGPELYDSAAGTWTNTGAMNTARGNHSMTLLPNGQVLVAGGDTASPSFDRLSGAELYDQDTGTWSTTGSMNLPRSHHAAVLLKNGKVLVAGGSGTNGSPVEAELYDPAAKQWTLTGSMQLAWGDDPAATVLANGKVLVAGGYGAGGWLTSAELYDPATGQWTMTGSMTAGRTNATATLLPNGTVLLIGGRGPGGVLAQVEVYDPATEIWTTTGPLAHARYHHAATLLPNGKVLVAAGTGDDFDQISSAEMYDPALGKWTPTGALNISRRDATATLLPNGRVLVAGGSPTNGASAPILSSSELYDVGLGFNESWRPRMDTVTSPLRLGASLAITGAGFRGVSGGSGGNSFQNSSTDNPVVQLRSVEGGQTASLLASGWTTNTYTSWPVWNFPPGYALATMFVNGIPSRSSMVNIGVPVPVVPLLLTNVQALGDGSVRFAFTNDVGALFGVWSSTDINWPMTNWTSLGGVREVAPGQFQFTDNQAANYPRRFYRVRSP